MEILPVIKLVEQDEPLKEENESDEEVEEVEEDIPDIAPEVVKKKEIPEEDIFVDKLKPKPAEKPAKKKRVLSEAQKEHLKKGREKALAVRRAKAQEKRELKELHEKKKKKDIQKLRDEVEDKPAPAPTPKSELPSTLQNLDPDFIRNLQQEAIEGYDKVRKERKAKKKEAEAQRGRDMRNMNVINNALNPVQPAKYGDSNFFSHLF